MPPFGTGQAVMHSTQYTARQHRGNQAPNIKPTFDSNELSFSTLCASAVCWIIDTIAFTYCTLTEHRGYRL